MSVYAGALTKKRRHCPKGVTGDLTDTHFQYNEVSDVGMIEARTQKNKFFQIFCMKDLNYVTNIMASWMTLDE